MYPRIWNPFLSSRVSRTFLLLGASLCIPFVSSAAPNVPTKSDQKSAYADTISEAGSLNAPISLRVQQAQPPRQPHKPGSIGYEVCEVLKSYDFQACGSKFLDDTLSAKPTKDQYRCSALIEVTYRPGPPGNTGGFAYLISDAAYSEWMYCLTSVSDDQAVVLENLVEPGPFSSGPIAELYHCRRTAEDKMQDCIKKGDPVIDAD